jgi:hypothetical protein
MEAFILVNLEEIKLMVLEIWNIQIKINMLDSLVMDKNMVEENIFLHKELF